MHYSRIMPPTGDHRYFTSTAVFLNELIKLAVSLSLAMYETSRTLAPSTPATVLFEQIYNAVFLSGDCWKLAIPAVFYTLQNLLQYVAIGNLDAVQFQVLYQLKILTTAIFSVVLLRRTLGVKRWMALLVLTLGVCVVSLPADSGVPVSLYLPDATDNFFPRSLHELGQASPELYQPQSPHLSRRTPYDVDIPGVEVEVEEEEHLQPQRLAKRAPADEDTIEVKVEDVKVEDKDEPAQPRRLSRRSATYEGITEDLGPPEEQMNYSVGVTAVLIAAAFSGLAGVSFEKLLKESPTQASLWIRNIQLSLYSLITALVGGVLYQDGEGIAQHGFFEGYNWVVWVLVVLQSCGGLVASLVIRDADNIVKNFATSISIVISFTASMIIFDFTVTWPVSPSPHLIPFLGSCTK